MNGIEEFILLLESLVQIHLPPILILIGLFTIGIDRKEMKALKLKKEEQISKWTGYSFIVGGVFFWVGVQMLVFILEL